MDARTCDVCGEDMPLNGGATCERGLFICKSHRSSGFLVGERKACPIDETPLSGW